MEYGNVVYTWHYDGPLAGTVTIDQADPTCKVLDEILHDALAGGPKFGQVVKLRRAPTFCTTPRPECGYPSHPLCFTGWTMLVEIPNGTRLVYVIGRYFPEDNTWEARWPD